ncbi:Holliday junction branch migration protein RuvA [Novosphingobium sp.]|uniref:Holliday junction branch migration protein RuvA n=1 Tax=Novosphingobium sp. TaxID=1874826 RepID=UPI003D144185
MIAKLTGILDDTGPDWAVIDVGGVGYLVHASARTLVQLGNPGDRAVLHTELQVSESDMRLIGFTTSGERAWFRVLMVVQGVGSKVALAILSALTVDELQRACAAGDAAMIARANGVGPKLASRIVNELKDKAGGLAGLGGGVGIIGDGVIVPPGSISGDAVSALQNLGFKPAIAATAVTRAIEDLGDSAALGDVMRVALKHATA